MPPKAGGQMMPGPGVMPHPGQPMPMVAAGGPQMMQQQPPHASESARRLKSRRPTDKTIPDGVEDAIIGDGVARYRDLRDYERRLDATMTRKRLDIVDPVNKGAKVRKEGREPAVDCFATSEIILTSGFLTFSAPKPCASGSAILWTSSRGRRP